MNDQNVLDRLASIKNYIYSIARKYSGFLCPGGAIDFDDLVSVGRMGALRASQTFDESRGVKFLTYASYWVEVYIRREIFRVNTLISLPSSCRSRKIGEYSQLKNKMVKKTIRLDANIQDDILSTWHDIVQDTKVADEVDQSNKHKNMLIFLQKLPLKERNILYSIFFEEKSYTEIGKEKNLTRQRVQQLANKGLMRLRELMTGKRYGMPTKRYESVV